MESQKDTIWGANGELFIAIVARCSSCKSLGAYLEPSLPDRVGGWNQTIYYCVLFIILSNLMPLLQIFQSRQCLHVSLSTGCIHHYRWRWGGHVPSAPRSAADTVNPRVHAAEPCCLDWSSSGSGSGSGSGGCNRLEEPDFSRFLRRPGLGIFFGLPV